MRKSTMIIGVCFISIFFVAQLWALRADHKWCQEPYRLHDHESNMHHKINRFNKVSPSKAKCHCDIN